jgi:hypothetical protein
MQTKKITKVDRAADLMRKGGTLMVPTGVILKFRWVA